MVEKLSRKIEKVFDKNGRLLSVTFPSGETFEYKNYRILCFTDIQKNKIYFNEKGELSAVYQNGDPLDLKTADILKIGARIKYLESELLKREQGGKKAENMIVDLSRFFEGVDLNVEYGPAEIKHLEINLDQKEGIRYVKFPDQTQLHYGYDKERKESFVKWVRYPNGIKVFFDKKSKITKILDEQEKSLLEGEENYEHNDILLKTIYKNVAYLDLITHKRLRLKNSEQTEDATVQNKSASKKEADFDDRPISEKHPNENIMQATQTKINAINAKLARKYSWKDWNFTHNPKFKVTGLRKREGMVSEDEKKQGLWERFTGVFRKNK